MNKILLNELYYRPEFRAMVSMSLAKEIAYLTGSNDADDKAFIALYMSGAGSDLMVEKVCKFAIDDPAIKGLGCYHELTDGVVETVVSAIFTNKREYLK